MTSQTLDNAEGKGTAVLSDAAELLGSLEEKSVKLIVTDPPYGIAYHSNHYVDKNPHAPVARDWNFQIRDLFQAAERVLSDDGAMYLFTRWDVYPLWFSSIPPGLKLRNSIVWKKDNWSAGDLEGNFGNQYELLLFVVKKAHKIRGKRWSNVWEFPRIPFNKLNVAAEKPVELLERAIEASSDPNDVVVDPYCGSGSTGVAAIRRGRRFLLGDIDKLMVDMTSRRLGLPVSTDARTRPPIPECPIMKVTPPEPHLWGIHPEDLAEVLAKEPSP